MCKACCLLFLCIFSKIDENNELLMDTVVLQAKVRDLNLSPKALRDQGWTPAELYGQGKDNVHLLVKAAEFEKVLRVAGESTIVSLEIEGQGSKSVLIQDVQHNLLKRNPDHADFFEVNMQEVLTATVQLEFVGEPVTVKALGGTLVKVISEVEVECLPKDLPHQIEVNTENLKTFDDQITVKDLVLPEGVKLSLDPDEVVAKVQPPRDVEAELAGPVEEDVTKVEGVSETADKEAADTTKES